MYAYTVNVSAGRTFRGDLLAERIQISSEPGTVQVQRARLSIYLVYIGNLESAGSGVLAGVARWNILAVCRDAGILYYIAAR